MVDVLSSAYLLIFGNHLVTCDLIAYTNKEIERMKIEISIENKKKQLCFITSKLIIVE